MSNNNNIEFNDREISDIVYEAYSDDDFNELEKMVAQGLDVNHKSAHRCLEYTEFNIDSMEKLAHLGYDVNYRCGFGKAPSWFNYFEDIDGDIDIMKRIINLKGLDVNSTDKRNNTIVNRIGRTIEELNRDISNDFAFEFITLLVEKGFDVTSKDKNENNVIHHFINFPKAVEYLMSLGLDLNNINKRSITPLMYFCQECDNTQEDLEIIQRYIELGVDIEIQIDNDESERIGWTTLHHAILARSPIIVKYLLSIGAKTDQILKDQKSILDIAIQYKNEEIIPIFFDEESRDYPSETKKSIIGYFMLKQEWKKIIEWYFSVPKEDMDWKTMHQLSYAYRKTGKLESATKQTLLAIETYGINNFLLDSLIFEYALTSQFEKAIEAWEKYNDTFKADEDPAANIIGHIIYVYDQLDQQKEAIESIKDYIEDAEDTGETRPGFMFFNVACLYATIEDIDNTIQYSALAILKGYDSKEFVDSAFNKIRDNEIFTTLMDFTIDSVIYKYMTKGNDSITFYTRCNDELEMIHIVNDTCEAQTLSFNDLGHMLRIMKDNIINFQNDGYSDAHIDFTKIWLPVYDDIFKRIAIERKDPIGLLNVEWDFDHNEGGMIRPYYVYSDNGYDLDHYDDIHYIPQKTIFDSVMKEVVKLDSFNALNKKNTFEIIQSEHDGGGEFFYTHESV